MSVGSPGAGAKVEVKVFPDATALFRAAADEVSRAARDAIVQHGRFTIALAGGSTPRSVYSVLANDDQNESEHRLPWDKVHFFFGDERNVPPDHADSNYRMASEALLSKIAVPAGNVHRIPGELPADQAAARYEQQLQSFFGVREGQCPRFDLIMLGMGPDGHTASLFPGSPALGERSHLVAANWVEKFNTNRITFTFPVLNNAAEVLFLVAGPDKREMLEQVLHPRPSGGAPYPSQQVAPSDGHLLWYVDAAAAGQA